LKRTDKKQLLPPMGSEEKKENEKKKINEREKEKRIKEEI
jgi:hypothetical protein